MQTKYQLCTRMKERESEKAITCKVKLKYCEYYFECSVRSIAKIVNCATITNTYIHTPLDNQMGINIDYIYDPAENTPTLFKANLILIIAKSYLHPF